MEKIPKRAVFKYVISGIVIFMVLMLSFKGIKLFIHNVPYLSIFELHNCYTEGGNLEFSGQQAFDWCGLSKAESLLEIDLEALRDRILNSHPEFKEVVIEKNYPDTIKVLVEPRIPFAQVKTVRFFKVDAQGFVFEDSYEDPLSRLPVIEGVGSRSVKKGMFCSSAALKKAIKIIRLLEARGFKDKYGIEKIDVANIDNISFYLKEDIEIKLGKDRFEEKTEKLEARLPNLDLSQIKYIDLRFKDLIVGPR